MSHNSHNMGSARKRSKAGSVGRAGWSSVCLATTGLAGEVTLAYHVVSCVPVAPALHLSRSITSLVHMRSIVGAAFHMLVYVAHIYPSGTTTPTRGACPSAAVEALVLCTAGPGHHQAVTVMEVLVTACHSSWASNVWGHLVPGPVWLAALQVPACEVILHMGACRKHVCEWLSQVAVSCEVLVHVWRMVRAMQTASGLGNRKIHQLPAASGGPAGGYVK